MSFLCMRIWVKVSKGPFLCGQDIFYSRKLYTKHLNHSLFFFSLHKSQQSSQYVIFWPPNLCTVPNPNKAKPKDEERDPGQTSYSQSPKTPDTKTNSVEVTQLLKKTIRKVKPVIANPKLNEWRPILCWKPCHLTLNLTNSNYYKEDSLFAIN